MSSTTLLQLRCLMSTVEAVQRYPILIQVESALWLCASVILAVGLYKVSYGFYAAFKSVSRGGAVVGSAVFGMG